MTNHVDFMSQPACVGNAVAEQLHPSADQGVVAHREVRRPVSGQVGAAVTLARVGDLVWADDGVRWGLVDAKGKPLGDPGEVLMVDEGEGIDPAHFRVSR